MSYDIYLKDPVDGDVITVAEPHFMKGGTYQVGGTEELWLNITYNYAGYYYDATEGDPRFAHEEERRGEKKTEYGIRGIYGKTGAESIPMLSSMIGRIERKYHKDGDWISTKREKTVWVDESGREFDTSDVCEFGLRFADLKEVTREYETREGPSDDYWEPTAGNALKPLYQLIAMAKMRPDGIWEGD